MKIGYGVEGTIDRGLVRGLRKRLCPKSELIEGGIRGSTKVSLWREIPRICLELQGKGAEFFVFLTDANEEEWRKKREREQSYVARKFRDFTVYGVAERNVECWLRADPARLADALHVDRSELERAENPKGIVEGSLKGMAPWEKEERIEKVVESADLDAWRRCSDSFDAFYTDARDRAKRSGKCRLAEDLGS